MKTFIPILVAASGVATIVAGCSAATQETAESQSAATTSVSSASASGGTGATGGGGGGGGGGRGGGQGVRRGGGGSGQGGGGQPGLVPSLTSMEFFIDCMPAVPADPINGNFGAHYDNMASAMAGTATITGAKLVLTDFTITEDWTFALQPSSS